MKTVLHDYSACMRWIMLLLVLLVAGQTGWAQTLTPTATSVTAGDAFGLYVDGLPANPVADYDPVTIYCSSEDDTRVLIPFQTEQWADPADPDFYTTTMVIRADAIRAVDGLFNPVRVDVVATYYGLIYWADYCDVTIQDPTITFVPVNPVVRVGETIPIAVKRVPLNSSAPLYTQISSSDGVLMGVGTDPEQLSTNNNMEVEIERFRVDKTIYVSGLYLPEGITSTNLTLSINVGSYMTNLIVMVTTNAGLTLAPAAPSVTAGNRISMSVTRNDSTNVSDMVVYLSSDDPYTVTVPSSITIPSGVQSLAFEAVGLKPGSSIVRATAAGVASSPDSARTVTVTDPELTFVPNPVTNQVNGTKIVTITRPYDQAGADLPLSLLASSTNIVSLETSSIVISNSYISASFVINGVAGGTTVVAAAVGSYSTNLTVVIEEAKLNLSGPTVTAGDVEYVTVSREGGPANQALVVNLLSHDPDKLVVPATVTIPVGQTNTTFVISAREPSAGITLEATAVGYTKGSSTIVISDPVLTFFSSPYQIQLGEVLITELRRSSNAVGGSLTVVLSSANESMFSVLPDPGVTFAAGETAKPITLTGLGQGNSEVRAQVGSYQQTANVSIVPGTDLYLSAAATVVAGNTTNLTITRETGTANAINTPMIVTLSSDDTNTVRVPATVTIPAGQSNTTFAATGVAPGAGAVNIRGTAAGFPMAIGTVTVTAPTVTITPAPFASLLVDGHAVISVDRGMVNNGAALTLNLASGDPALFSVGAQTVTIPANTDASTFTIYGASAGTNDVFVSVGSYQVSREVRVANAGLMLSSPTVTAGAQAPMTVVRQGGSLVGDLVVALNSHDPARLVVPASVTIPAGQSNAIFTITGVSPSAGVTVDATATGYAIATASVTVDDPTLTFAGAPYSLQIGEVMVVELQRALSGAPLTVALSSLDAGVFSIAPASVTFSINETSKAVTLTAVGQGHSEALAQVDGYQLSADVECMFGDGLTISGPATVVAGSTTNLTLTRDPATLNALNVPLEVTLSSDDADSVTVPATVTIPAGQPSTIFPATGVAPGAGAVIIRASALGYPMATNVVTVTDPSVTVMPTTFVSLLVGGQAVVSVSRGTTHAAADLVLEIASGDPAVFSAPASVIIPANLESATFSIQGLTPGTNEVFVSAGSYQVSREVRVATAGLTLTAGSVYAG
ncbi:MAG: hypothetical protein EOM20_13010, partial [Spartobacteria bacterium]|nr:hypothetical protein [Spartobacteria bacterium]